MRQERPARRGLLAAITLWTLVPSAISAFVEPPVPQRVRLLADTDGAFAELGLPSCSETDGGIAFYGISAAGRESVFLSWGAPPLPVATVGEWIDDPPERHRVTSLSEFPTVASGGRVALIAGFANGSAVIVRSGTGGLWDFAADSGEAFQQFLPRAVIDDEGEVLFAATIDPPGHPDRDDFDPDLLEAEGVLDDPDRLPPPPRPTVRGLERRHHVGLFLDSFLELLLVSSTRDWAELDERFAVDGRGRAAYRALDFDGSVEMVLDDGYALPFTLARSDRRIEDFGPPSMNALGDVVFAARDRSSGRWALFHGRQGRVRPTVLFAAEASRGVRPGVAVGARGEVVAVVLNGEGPERGEQLVRRNTDGSIDVLLSRGATLAGRTVETIELSSEPFAGALGLLVRVGLVDRDGELSAAIAAIPIER